MIGIRVKIDLERSGAGIIAPSMLLVEPGDKYRVEVERAMMSTSGKLVHSSRFGVCQ
jgi:hypothetical protein